jgi:hypothetical protein
MMRRVLMTVGALLCVGLASAQAHENRQVGDYTLTVGFRVEPAFEDAVNAIDIFVNRTSDGKAISVRDGDVVDSAWRCSCERLTISMRKSWRRSRCGRLRARILPPTIDITPGLSRPMTVPMPSGSPASSKTPATHRPARKPSRKPMSAGTAPRAAPRASIASKTRKPSPAIRRLAIATTTPSVSTREAS